MDRILLVIFALAAVPMIVLRLAIPRRKFAPAPLAVALIGIASMFGGIVLSHYAGARVERATGEGSRPVVDGVVTRSVVGGKDMYAPEIDYEFVVDSVRYTGTSDRHVPLFGNRRRMLEVARKEVDRFPVGTKVAVFYNPNDPTDNTIQPEPRWNDLAQTGLGIFMFAGGLFMALWPRRKKT